MDEAAGREGTGTLGGPYRNDVSALATAVSSRLARRLRDGDRLDRDGRGENALGELRTRLAAMGGATHPCRR